MRRALDEQKRDIVFSLCQYGMGSVWEWGAEVGGNCWRTTGDIEDTWQSVSSIAIRQTELAEYAGPGHWNDPDMLVVGMVGWGPQLHPSRLTRDEQYTHITLWCLLSAPLLIGCDLTRLDEFTLGLLTNDEVLAINQDAAGKQAHLVDREDDSEVWAKELSDGTLAVGLFNRDSKPNEVSVTFGELGIKGAQPVRDLWGQKELGRMDKNISLTIAPHGAALLKIGAPK